MKFKYPLLSFIVLLFVGFLCDLTLDSFLQINVLLILVNIVLAMSLNLVNGYTGQFSLGHAGFMAIGAYVSGYGGTHFNFFGPGFEMLQFAIFTILGGCLAAFAGYLVGKPSLRLKGDYLAIVTLGFSEIIRVALLNMNAVGGARGLANIPGFSSFVWSFGYAIFWVLVCFFTIWRLIRSSHGRGLLAVKEDEIAAEAMGIDTAYMKVKAFVISSFFAGVAGGLYAHFYHFISPGSFTFLQSVNVIIMVVLGGMGSLSGSILAAIIIVVLPEFLRPLQDLTGIDLRMVIYSLLLILMMILRPQGLFGDLEITDIWRKYAKK